MEPEAVFVATLSAILLIVLMISTLKWWRNRIETLRRDIRQSNRNSHNDTDANDNNWIFSIERGTDRQLIRYSIDEQQPMRHTNCRHYANSEKSIDNKAVDGLPSYDEAMKAQQQHDIKLANSNSALAGSVV